MKMFINGNYDKEKYLREETRWKIPEDKLFICIQTDKEMDRDKRVDIDKRVRKYPSMY